jgi:predicted transcriptional regulator
MRRSRLEILLNVLEIIHKGETKPTRIMYRANLSYKLLKNVLDTLIQQNLILKIDSTNNNNRKRDHRTNTLYEITLKGQNVLRYFYNARGLLETESNFNPFRFTE